MGGLGMTEILIVGAIALLFFGPSRLPSLGQALGKTISNFKKGINEIDGDEASNKLISKVEKEKSSIEKES